jgi:hypothetical protein
MPRVAPPEPGRAWMLGWRGPHEATRGSRKRVLLLPLYLFITLSPTSCYAGCPLQYSRLGQPARASLCRQMAHSR